MGFLTEAVERVRRELERNPPTDDGSLLRVQALPPALDVEGALNREGMSLIAEVKRASPSAGPIAEADAGQQAERYERGGAAAISVLTEGQHFGGALADLRLARRHTALPVLRKDFIVHPAQILEARAHGADGILLIAAALTDAELRDLRDVAEGFGMDALVEAHTGEDLERAAASGARIIGVNSRDLETLEVDLDGALRLLARAPRDRVLVLESGVHTRRQVAAAEAAGANAVLVGEALMRAADPGAKVRELVGD